MVLPVDVEAGTFHVDGKNVASGAKRHRFFGAGAVSVCLLFLLFGIYSVVFSVKDNNLLNNLRALDLLNDYAAGAPTMEVAPTGLLQGAAQTSWKDDTEASQGLGTSQGPDAESPSLLQSAANNGPGLSQVGINSTTAPTGFLSAANQGIPTSQDPGISQGSDISQVGNQITETSQSTGTGSPTLLQSAANNGPSQVGINSTTAPTGLSSSAANPGTEISQITETGSGFLQAAANN